MNQLTRLAAIAIFLIPVLLAWAPDRTGEARAASQTNAAATSITFPETGKTVSGKLLTYWQAHGGLAAQGEQLGSEHVPARGKGPFRLRIEIGVGHGIVLVALEFTGHAEIVDVALAPFGHAVVIDTGADEERCVSKLHLPRQA